MSTRLAPRVAGPTDAAAHAMADALALAAPHLVDDMLAALPTARDVVNRRLVAAAHRERLAGSPDDVMWAGSTAFLPLGDGGVVVARALRHGFDRIEVEDVLDADPALLLARLTGGGQASAAVAAELTDATVNLALAYARRRHLIAVPSGPRDSLDLFDGDADAFCRLLERFATEGHNLHPCGRTRLGWTVPDVLAHDVEAGATEVGLAAVPRELHIGDEIGAELSPSTLDPRRYAVTPVHAWQLRHLRTRYADDSLIVPLEVTLPAAPTAALRTLLLAAGHSPRYLKLSLDIQVTSTRRTVSVASTRNGPVLTRLIGDLIDDDRVLLMAETAGSAVRLPHGDRDLSVIARAGLAGRLAPGELAVPGTALTAASPIPGPNGRRRTVLAELVDRYALTRRLSGAVAAGAFLDTYTRLLLPPLLRLATRHGIGLEAHLQNCVPTFIDGVPHRLALRDFAGLRLNPERLSDRPALWPGSVVVTDSLDTVRAKIGYTALQAHLGELVAQLSRGYGVDEDAAWAGVRDVVDEIYDGLRGEPAIAGRAAADYAFFTAAHVPHKALLSMRLSGRSGDMYVPVGNPLR